MAPLGLGILFQAHMVDGQIYFLIAVRLKLFFYLATLRSQNSHPLYPTPPQVSHHVTLSKHNRKQLTSSKLAKESLQSAEMDSLIKHNLIKGVIILSPFLYAIGQKQVTGSAPMSGDEIIKRVTRSVSFQYPVRQIYTEKESKSAVAL